MEVDADKKKIFLLEVGCLCVHNPLCTEWYWIFNFPTLQTAFGQTLTERGPG